MTSHELNYRLRVTVEIHNAGVEIEESEPCRIIPVMDSFVATTLVDAEHEVDTDRGVMIDRQIEVDGSELVLSELAEMPDIRSSLRSRAGLVRHAHPKEDNPLTKLLLDIAEDSADRAILSLEPECCEDVRVEDDSE
jgi:hypothetical protein